MMFVNVSGDSENVSESFYSLTFASRCRATALGEAKKHVSSLRRASSSGPSSRGPPSPLALTGAGGSGGSGGDGTSRGASGALVALSRAGGSSSRSLMSETSVLTDFGDADLDGDSDGSPRSEITPRYVCEDVRKGGRGGGGVIVCSMWRKSAQGCVLLVSLGIVRVDRRFLLFVTRRCEWCAPPLPLPFSRGVQHAQLSVVQRHGWRVGTVELGQCGRWLWSRSPRLWQHDVPATGCLLVHRH